MGFELRVPNVGPAGREQDMNRFSKYWDIFTVYNFNN
jgi:hypothetical protein